MVDKALEIFIETADSGSFSKAAERLYITHTAVIKRLNHLESSIGVQLLERSPQGVKLTAAGEVFYREAVELIRLSREMVKRVRSVGKPEVKILRVGTSVLSPCQDFLEFWQQDGNDVPLFQFQIIPFSDDRRRYEHLGKDFDFLIGAFDNRIAQSECRLLPIGKYRFALLMGRGHHLTKRKSLKFKDLHGETVMVMKSGVSPVNDRVRETLAEEHPDVRIEDIPPVYNVATFNLCAESEKLLLSLECWKNVHPALTTVPLDEDYSIPYGAIAAKASGKYIDLFFEALKEKVQQ